MGGTGSQNSRHANCSAAGKRHVISCLRAADRQVVVVESGNGLRTGSIEIDRAAGDGVRVGPGSEGCGHTDGAAAG